MKYVIKINDIKGKGYFSHFGFWNLPIWVSKIKEARTFETKQDAQQWIKEFLGTKRKYTIEAIKN